MVVVTRQALLQLTHVQEILLPDPTAKLSDQGDMFAHVSGQFAKLGVILHETFHVRDGIDVHGVLGLGLILLDVLFDVLAQVSEVLVHVLLEERVLVLGEDDLAELRPDLGHIPQIDAPIMDPHQLMDHGLVSPLGE